MKGSFEFRALPLGWEVEHTIALLIVLLLVFIIEGLSRRIRAAIAHRSRKQTQRLRYLGWGALSIGDEAAFR
jgi:hypothetical protein